MALSRQTTAKITDLLKEYPQGLSITDIVKKIDINRNTAGRYLENLLVSGQVEMRHFGMAKIYALSNRIPQSAMLSISSDLVMQLDSSLRIVYVNEPFLNLLRVTSTDISGKNIEYSAAVLLFEDTLEDFIALLKTGISGKEWHGTLALNKGDLFYSCYITPMVLNDGRKGVSVRLEDLTELRHHEIALQESEARLRSILSAAPVGIGVISDRVILEVNNRFCQMTGYSTGELIGSSTRILYPTDEDFERASSKKYSIMARTGAGNIQLRWKKKDGSIIDILLNSALLNPADIQQGITITALDITEQSRAEQGLRESEERYRNLVEISPDAILLHQEGKIIYGNPAARTLLGASCPDEIIGKRIIDFIDPGFRKSVTENILKDLNGELSLPTEVKMLRLDGTSVTVEGKGVKTTRDGKSAVLAALRDITGQKLSEVTIRESEEKFRTLFNNTDDMILVHSITPDGQSGHYTEVNDVACRVLKYTRNEFLHMLPQELVAPELLETALRSGRQLLTDGHVTAEFVLLSKDARKIPVEINAHLFELRGQTLVLAIIRDITGRKAKEDALKISEERYRSLVETTGTGYVILDKTGHVITANQEYIQLTGRSTLNEILGRPVTEWTAPYDLERNAQQVEQCYQSGQVRDLEIDYQKPDGTIQPIEINASVIRHDSGAIILALCRDITERRRTEAMLKENERKYRFLAENSVDIINRLNSEYVCTYVSQAGTSVLGYPERELLGKTLFEFVHPDDLDRVLRELTCITDKRIDRVTLTFRLRHKQGHYLWLESTTNVIRNPKSGKIQELFSISRDITKRKKLESELNASVGRYQQLAECSLDALIITDLSGNIVTTNQTALTLFEVEDPETIQGRSIFGFVAPESLQSAKHDFAGMEPERNGVRQYYTGVTSRGNKISIEVLGTPITYMGTPSHILCVRNISKPK
ncbi:MAG: PAS domain S-box protein [Methanoregula sp.]|nr:PAS domain S-box protein [Methanoregula sp.]